MCFAYIRIEFLRRICVFKYFLDDLSFPYKSMISYGKMIIIYFLDKQNKFNLDLTGDILTLISFNSKILQQTLILKKKKIFTFANPFLLPFNGEKSSFFVTTILIKLCFSQWHQKFKFISSWMFDKSNVKKMISMNGFRKGAKTQMRKLRQNCIGSVHQIT